VVLPTHNHFEPAGSRLAGAMSADAVDAFGKGPLVEAATLVSLAFRFRHDILPAHALSSGQRPQKPFHEELQRGAALAFLLLLVPAGHGPR
jgi:hypothetical protein